VKAIFKNISPLLSAGLLWKRFTNGLSDQAILTRWRKSPSPRNRLSNTFPSTR